MTTTTTTTTTQTASSHAFLPGGDRKSPSVVCACAEWPRDGERVIPRVTFSGKVWINKENKRATP